jgi:type IV pilus assembly protein PilB
MLSHPDADAFMRVYLRDPTDTPTRLVFADWLEETGRPWNAAWAHYIRLKAEADRHLFGTPERRELEREAAAFAPHIRANLTIPAALFVGYPKSLLQLLPAPNITVSLDGFATPRDAVEVMPESIARENEAFPLGFQDRIFLVAATHPAGTDLVPKLEFILNRHVVAVRGEADEIAAAIDLAFEPAAGYPPSMLGQVTNPLFFPPPFSPDADDSPIARLLNLVLAEALQHAAHRARVSRFEEVGTVRFLTPGGWVDREFVPERLVRPLAARTMWLCGLGYDAVTAPPAAGSFRWDYHGFVYTIRATYEATPAGPALDLDISDTFELV